MITTTGELEEWIDRRIEKLRKKRRRALDVYEACDEDEYLDKAIALGAGIRAFKEVLAWVRSHE